jgi:hypothetical protein
MTYRSAIRTIKLKKMPKLMLSWPLSLRLKSTVHFRCKRYKVDPYTQSPMPGPTFYESSASPTADQGTPADPAICTTDDRGAPATRQRALRQNRSHGPQSQAKRRRTADVGDPEEWTFGHYACSQLIRPCLMAQRGRRSLLTYSGRRQVQAVACCWCAALQSML